MTIKLCAMKGMKEIGLQSLLIGNRHMQVLQYLIVIEIKNKIKVK